ncbi:MAG: glycosyltransferase, partial [Bacteroidales bacterium]|nr:glycosyltransferase [Bacteroidales bacterium]
DKNKCREILNLDLQKKYILFSSFFSNAVKNYPLASKAISLLGYKENVELLELKDCNREQVCLLMNAVDISLMTSTSEGSSQFVKEAMACNCPIVSTDVGDVRQNIKNLEGCYITSFDSQDVAKKLDLAFKFGKRTKGRERIYELGLDIKTVTQNIISIYEKVIS